MPDEAHAEEYFQELTPTQRALHPASIIAARRSNKSQLHMRPHQPLFFLIIALLLEHRRDKILEADLGEGVGTASQALEVRYLNVMEIIPEYLLTLLHILRILNKQLRTEGVTAIRQKRHLHILLAVVAPLAPHILPRDLLFLRLVLRRLQWIGVLGPAVTGIEVDDDVLAEGALSLWAENEELVQPRRQVRRIHKRLAVQIHLSLLLPL